MIVWRFSGRARMIFLISSRMLLSISVSASSSTSVRMYEVLRTLLLIRCNNRPGVPTIAEQFCRFFRSTLISMPPIKLRAWNFGTSAPIMFSTPSTCTATSRVGTMVSDCGNPTFGLCASAMAMANTSVFPVPAFAWTSKSKKQQASGTARACIGDANVNPFLLRALRTGSDMCISVKRTACSKITSSVRGFSSLFRSCCGDAICGIFPFPPLRCLSRVFTVDLSPATPLPPPPAAGRIAR
uniref:Putative secreted protein n=1 Tax=Anopheles darlingi TaxID=43151 RepID=A0A2M4DDT5_ANODA